MTSDYFLDQEGGENLRIIICLCLRRTGITEFINLIDYFLLEPFTYGSDKKADETKDKEFTLADESSAYHRLQTKCQPVLTNKLH